MFRHATAITALVQARNVDAAFILVSIQRRRLSTASPLSSRLHATASISVMTCFVTPLHLLLSALPRHSSVDQSPLLVLDVHLFVGFSHGPAAESAPQDMFKVAFATDFCNVLHDACATT